MCWVAVVNCVILLTHAVANMLTLSSTLTPDSRVQIVPSCFLIYCKGDSKETETGNVHKVLTLAKRCQ